MILRKKENKTKQETTKQETTKQEKTNKINELKPKTLVDTKRIITNT